MTRLITPEEAAGRLGVATATVKKWLRADTLPGGCKPNGKIWRIREDALNDYIRTLATTGKRRRR